LAIAEDFQGRRQFEISFRQLAGKKWQNAVIKNTSGNIIWTISSNNFSLNTMPDFNTVLVYWFSSQLFFTCNVCVCLYMSEL
ncbi:MAG: hypothetical protein ACTS8P_01530, partial [Arsenophonus sp. NC-XBC3-MAG3]